MGRSSANCKEVQLGTSFGYRKLLLFAAVRIEFRDGRKTGEHGRSKSFAIGGLLACTWGGSSNVGRPSIG